MPVTRYQLRNEYGLADSDLYRAADKDDSEALLEAVAMAGLVGVLRQLGDLAEFAAEIFHDLHEEVLATAARGHTLAVRAHQLEAEVPAIEKTFLSQNKNPSFFTNTGIDWHPILHTDENLITRGDLPRCVMDSFEECLGPPRLFLLDKFDVAGAGTCLKRYTDPSFFKNVTDSSKLKALDVQREKKMHKTKKKGPPLKNGETHQNFPTSHAKLHELFMEERIGNNFDNPSCLVKLKKRQLNGSPFDFRSGKTYMEKFLQTPSPEHKVVYETSADPPPLKLTLDNSSESGNETVDIGIVSPVTRSWEIKESICSSPNSLEMALKPNKEELDSEISALETAKAHVLASAVDTGRIPSIPARVTDMDIQGSSPAGLVYANDAIIDLGQASGSSCLSDRNIKYVPFDNKERFVASPRKYELDEALSKSDKPDSEVFSTDGVEFSRSITCEVIHVDHCCTNIVCTDRPLLDELHGEEEPISPDAMTHLSRSPELDTEYESRCTYLDQVRQTGSTEENAEENPAPLATISMKSTIMPLEEQLSSKLSETGHSDEKLLPDMLEVMRPANSSSEVSVNLANTNPLVEILQCQGTNEQQSDSVHSDIGAHSDNYLLPRMFEVSNDVAASTACGTIFHDDNDNHGSVPSVLIVSPSRSPMISEEHHPGSEIPYEQAHKFTKRIYPEHLIYSEAETDQGKVSTQDSDSVVSKPGSCNNSQREDVTQNSTLTEKVDTAMLGKLTSLPPSHLVDLDVESKLLCSPHLPGNSDNVAAPPNLNSETHSEQLLELLSNQIHGESPRGDDACPNSSKLISGRLQPHIGQVVCFALDEPSLGDLPGQHPIPSAGVFAQSVDQEIDQVKHTIASFPSGFGLVHEATNLGMVEMPPLPPVQWRMGNAQLDSRDSQSELVGNAEESFALTSEYGVDRKGQLDFSAPMLQGVESRSMYPLSEDVEVKQHHFSDKSADSLAQPTGFVVDMSSMADDTSIRHSSASFEYMQSSPSFVIEAMSRKRQEYGSPIEENDREGFRRPFAQVTGLEKTISGHDAMSLLENQAVPSDPHIVDSATEGIVQAILPECGARVEDSVGMPITQTANGQEQPSNNQENQAPVNLKGQPQVNDEVQHATEAVEHPLHDLAKFGGEMQPTCIPPIKHCLPISEAAPLSHSKAPLFGANRKVNGNPAIKNPRPEDPLIDVFAALDKSRLRKVSKQVRPQVGSKVDERDSLLEQIRTKSFNLRPAGATRPSIQRIQGPITNLRVAAILEKANTIRQATAGSDEEGDDDSWSDS